MFKELDVKKEMFIEGKREMVIERACKRNRV